MNESSWRQSPVLRCLGRGTRVWVKWKWAYAGNLQPHFILWVCATLFHYLYNLTFSPTVRELWKWLGFMGNTLICSYFYVRHYCPVRSESCPDHGQPISEGVHFYYTSKKRSYNVLWKSFISPVFVLLLILLLNLLFPPGPCVLGWLSLKLLLCSY